VSGAPNAVRRAWLQGVAAAVAGSGLAGCEPAQEPLRIGAHVFPGYEMLFLARQLGQLPDKQVRLIEMPSASASLRALASGALEGACLTLDEVLMARDRGVPLTVVLVLDVSMGADTVLARPVVRDLADLRGRSIAVEQSAVGAVMLDAMLQAAGLLLADVRPVHLPIDEHERAYADRRVDAVVTFEPATSRLRAAGARQLFSSREAPGLVLDVLAVRPPFLASHRLAIATAVTAHLGIRDRFAAAPSQYAAQLAPRLGLTPDQVPAAFNGLEMPDLARNRQLLTSPQGLRATAERLAGVMRRAGLIAGALDARGLVDAGFVGVS
jgi:NitT/TauT family transport system substrate-binding protein